jgi:hypothetical protein
VDDDLDNRRHWHSSCWQKKDQRKPKTLRSRNAPKY